MGRPTAYVCQGSDCRERRTDRKKLRDALSDVAVEVPVKCQKICKGPVVGLTLDDEVVWFRSVRGKKQRKAVKALLRGEGLAPELARLRVRKRDGKLRSG